MKQHWHLCVAGDSGWQIVSGHLPPACGSLLKSVEALTLMDSLVTCPS